MKPVLYYDELSPPVRGCLMLIKHLEIDVDLQPLELFKQEHLAPEFVKINPLHTVPTLKDGNLVLTDSHAILTYLADKYGAETDLYPQDEAIRAQIINKLFFEGCVLFKQARDVMHDMMRNKNADNLDNFKESTHEAYSLVETFLSSDDGPYLAGPNMTIADISVVVTLSAMDLFFPITDEWPLLKKWFEEMTAIPSYIEGAGPGLEKWKNAVQSLANIDWDKRRQES